MIYAQLWDHETLDKSRLDMRDVIEEDPTDRKVCSCEGGLFAVGTYLCSRHRLLPHFTKPAYVGKEAAQEVIEAWHMEMYEQEKQSPQPHELVAEDIPNAVCGNPFLIGQESSAFLRTLYVNIDLWTLECPEDDCAISNLAERQRVVIEPLLKIQKKAGFKLTIELEQKRIRLNMLQQIFPAMKTILDAFETKGANVCVLFVYTRPDYDKNSGEVGDFKTVTPFEGWELNDAIKHPESDWKEKLVAFLGSVRILSHLSRKQHQY
jgi:hypothetical protein